MGTKKFIQEANNKTKIKPKEGDYLICIKTSHYYNEEDQPPYAIEGHYYEIINVFQGQAEIIDGQGRRHGGWDDATFSKDGKYDPKFKYRIWLYVPQEEFDRPIDWDRLTEGEEENDLGWVTDIAMNDPILTFEELFEYGHEGMEIEWLTQRPRFKDKIFTIVGIGITEVNSKVITIQNSDGFRGNTGRKNPKCNNDCWNLWGYEVGENMTRTPNRFRVIPK